MKDFVEYDEIEEIEEQQEEFEINDAQTANWAINKIAEDKKRMDYFIDCANAEIKKLNEQIKDVKAKYERSTQFLSGKLGKYLEKEEVPKKKTKTQESVTLPAGKIVKKLEKTTIVMRNGKEVADDKKNEEFIKNVEEIDPTYIKTSKEVNWGELKKTLDFDNEGNVFVKDTGEFIDSLTTCVSLPSIEIKPNE